MKGISCLFILIYLDCTKYNEINIFFDMLKNIYSAKYGMKNINASSMGATQMNLVELGTTSGG